jgi:hypothetical protein
MATPITTRSRRLVTTLKLCRNVLDEVLLAANDDLIVGWLWAAKVNQYWFLNKRVPACGRTTAQPGLFFRVRWSTNTRKEVLQPKATAANDSPMEFGFDLDRNCRLILDRVDDGEDRNPGSRACLFRSAESNHSCIRLILGHIDTRPRVGNNFG